MSWVCTVATGPACPSKLGDARSFGVGYVRDGGNLQVYPAAVHADVVRLGAGIKDIHQAFVMCAFELR